MELNQKNYPNYTAKNFIISFSLCTIFILLNIISLLVITYFARGIASIVNVAQSTISSSSSSSTSSMNVENSEFAKFSDESEFNEYLKNASFANSNSYLTSIARNAVSEGKSPLAQDKSETTNNFSTTNVQTLGVDEPDVLKSDGKFIYFSQEGYQYFYGANWRLSPVVEDAYPIIAKGSTQIIKMLPVDKISKLKEIEDGGALMLYKNTLVINSNNTKLTAYNTTDFSKLWEIKFQNNEYIRQLRSIEGDLFVSTASVLNSSTKCLMPLYNLENFSNSKTESVGVKCTDIYFPSSNISDTTKVTVLKLSFEEGVVENKISFLASSSGNDVLYMSTNNIYFAYQKNYDSFKLLSNFLGLQNEIPNTIKNKLNYLSGLDISVESKLTEIAKILNDYNNSLSTDERLKIQNELQNNFEDYITKNIENIVKSGIVKISKNLEIQSNSEVLGYMLNQFSLDEYNSKLRIATTVEPSIYLFNFVYSNSSKSYNTVQTLDENLNVLDIEKNIGKGEKIYSVRFVENSAFLVTFRQVDPFYILDLTDSKNIKVAGELKIPGYSSYLHQLPTNEILGVGMEGGKLKLSLFDVSNSSSPVELSKYLLAEYGSEVLQDHHAFLHNSSRKTFFIPAYNGGYIFSYENDKLELVKSISGNSVKRAMYVNDYLYVIFTDKLVVLDKSYERIAEISL